MPQIFRNATVLLAPCDCTQTMLSRAVSMRSQIDVLNLRDSLVAWAPECGHSDPPTDRFADKVSVKRTICPGQAEPVRTMSLG